MLTIMVQAKIKEEKLPEYLEMAELLTCETKGKRPGCISYSFNQSLETPTEFVLYEQWESQESLDNHIRELSKLLGQPKPGYLLPEKLMEMYEWAKPVFYREVGQNT
ncbi:antibiotic biosynthesis monooxygenase [Vibrio sp. PP-XX7]